MNKSKIIKQENNSCLNSLFKSLNLNPKNFKHLRSIEKYIDDLKSIDKMLSSLQKAKPTHLKSFK